MRATTVRWCNWSGFAFLLLWLVGFVFCAHPTDDDLERKINALVEARLDALRGGA